MALFYGHLFEFSDPTITIMGTQFIVFPPILGFGYATLPLFSKLKYVTMFVVDVVDVVDNVREKG